MGAANATTHATGGIACLMHMGVDGMTVAPPCNGCAFVVGTAGDANADPGAALACSHRVTIYLKKKITTTRTLDPLNHRWDDAEVAAVVAGLELGPTDDGSQCERGPCQFN